MNEPASPQPSPGDLSHDELMSALFAHMVIQNTNMALMLLGQVPHPESGERIHDLDAAKMFIDQLEMLAVKTKGNLTREEEKLLQQSLTHLRMTFVQSVEKPSGPAPEKKPGAETDPQSGAALPPAEPPSSQEEPRKRFSKKF